MRISLATVVAALLRAYYAAIPTDRPTQQKERVRARVSLLDGGGWTH